MRDPATFQSGQMVGGHYQLRKLLGKGGMGVVWQAYDKSLKVEVALKFLRDLSADPESIEDMRREVVKSRNLTHVNIIRIHTLEEHDGEPPFISMEYVEGSSLHALLQKQPKRHFEWQDLRKIVAQFCAGLEYAHEQSVVHRDLKPANLILNNQFQLKLADFGLAASLSGETRGNNSAGTIAYMSPQQMRGRDPQVTDDIYAMGATLYELLTGKPPFYQGDISTQVREVDPEPVGLRLQRFGRNCDMPENVGRAILACLAKEPNARPQSVRDVAEWMFGEVEPPPPPPPPPPPSATTARGWVFWGVGVGGAVFAAVLWLALQYWESHTPAPRSEPSPTPAPGPSTPFPLATPKPHEEEPPPAPPVEDSDKIFNETNLDQWEASGTPGFWSVNAEDHVIEANLARLAGRSRSTETLRWKGGAVADFYFTFAVRLAGRPPPDSTLQFGVRYRVDETKGYRCLLNGDSESLGQLARLAGGILSRPDFVVTTDSGGKTILTAPKVQYRRTLPHQLEANRWYNFKIETEFTKLAHSIEGNVCAVVDDQDARLRSRSGAVDLYVVADGATNAKIEFRDLNLHRK